MKNRYLILLAGLLVAGSLLLVACGDKNDKPADTKAPTAAQTNPATDPADETTAPEADTTVAEDETTVAEDETTVAEDDTTVAEDDTTVAEDDTTAAENDNTEADTEPSDPARYESWMMWTDFVPHVCLDSINPNSNIAVNLKDSADPIALDNTIANLFLYGWAAVTEESYEFAYVIDDGEIITDPGFTVVATQDVIDAIAGVGGIAGNRFGIVIDVAALEGAHNVKALVRVGELYFIMAEFNIDKSGITEVETEDDATADNIEAVDFSTLAGQDGYQPNFVAAGYMGPILSMEYDKVISLGTLDLSKYSMIRIEYGCDGSPLTEERFAALTNGATIGLKNEATSYGKVNEYNMEGDIAHTEMTFSSSSWAGGARWAEIDLTNVNYNGEVWFAIHNPEGTGIAVSAIQFVLAETEAETTAPEA